MNDIFIQDRLMNENRNHKDNFSVLSNDIEEVKSKIVNLMAKDLALTEKNGQLGSKVVQLENKDTHLMTKDNEISTKVDGNTKKFEELKSEFVSS